MATTWRKCCNFIQRQIIGALPGGSQQDCLFYYAPDVNIDFWSIDSYSWDEVDALNTFLNPYGIYYNIYTTNNIAEPRFVLTYVGTEPPTYKPTINDPNANPIIWDWTNCCDKVCLEGTFGVDQYALFQSGYFFEALQTFPFDDPYNTTLFKSLYGQQTTYTYTDNGDGTFYIKIDNAFVCNLPLSWSEDNATYTDMVPCGYVPPVAPYCYYYAYVDFFTENLTQLYLDEGATQQLINDIYGNGNLRNQLTSLGGDIYWFMLDNDTFTFQGSWLYYYGNTPTTIDIYDQFGILFTSIYFQEGSASGVSCDSENNYEMTFDKGYDRFSRFGFESINNINAQIPTSTPYTSDYTDLTLMQDLITWTFGNGASYNLIDNGATYTMQIRNAIYWNGYPRWELYDGGGNTIQLTMTPF